MNAPRVTIADMLRWVEHQTTCRINVQVEQGAEGAYYNHVHYRCKLCGRKWAAVVAAKGPRYVIENVVSIGEGHACNLELGPAGAP